MKSSVLCCAGEAHPGGRYGCHETHHKTGVESTIIRELHQGQLDVPRPDTPSHSPITALHLSSILIVCLYRSPHSLQTLILHLPFRRAQPIVSLITHRTPPETPLIPQNRISHYIYPLRRENCFSRNNTESFPSKKGEGEEMLFSNMPILFCVSMRLVILFLGLFNLNLQLLHPNLNILEDLFKKLF